jgi:hypothetical protein
MKIFKWEITVRPLNRDKEIKDYFEYLLDDFPIDIVEADVGGYEVVLPRDPLPWIDKKVPEDIRGEVLDMYSKKIREARMDAHLKTADWKAKMKKLSGGEVLGLGIKKFDPSSDSFTQENEP